MEMAKSVHPSTGQVRKVPAAQAQAARQQARADFERILPAAQRPAPDEEQMRQWWGDGADPAPEARGGDQGGAEPRS